MWTLHDNGKQRIFCSPEFRQRDHSHGLLTSWLLFLALLGCLKTSSSSVETSQPPPRLHYRTRAIKLCVPQTKRSSKTLTRSTREGGGIAKHCLKSHLIFIKFGWAKFVVVVDCSFLFHTPIFTRSASPTHGFLNGKDLQQQCHPPKQEKYTWIRFAR